MLGEESQAGCGIKRSFLGWFRGMFGSADGRGDGDWRGRLGRRRHGSQNTGVAAGVKPRSRGAVRVFAQGFTRGDSLGEDECGVLGICVERKNKPQPGNVGWGLSAVLILQVPLLRPLAAGYRNERFVICDQSLVRCEDERISILIFPWGCCGLDTHTQRGRSGGTDDVAVVRPRRFPGCWIH